MMKITPIEIRQKIFEKTLRGYNKEEVSAFLITLSREWEHMQDEIRQMRTKLNSKDREINKLREMESSLHKTLKAAENASANAVEQANKQAELCVKEAHLQADSLLKKTQLDAENIINNSKKTATQVLTDMDYKLKELAQNYRAVAATKKDLIRELNHTVNEINERVKSLQHQADDFDLDQYLSHLKDQHDTIVTDMNTNTSPLSEEDKTDPDMAEKRKQEDPSNTSFFDQV